MAGNGNRWFATGARLGCGQDVVVERRKGLEWCRQAGGRGDVGAVLMRGRCLKQGLDGEADMEEGLVWYRKAEAAGLAQASADMAQLKIPLRQPDAEENRGGEKPSASKTDAHAVDSQTSVG